MRAIKRHFYRAAAAFAAVFFVFFLNTSAYASSSDFEVTDSSYTGDKDGGGTVTLTVENSGPDFGGYVRVVIAEGMRGTSTYAYEVYTSIAEDEEEIIKIRIPRIENEDLSDCEARVQIMDDHYNLKFETKLRHLFDDRGILYGTISEHPGNLSYFESEYYSGYNYITGQRNGGLTQDTRDLKEMTDPSELSGLTYLLIDDFDSSELSDEGISAIEQWTNGGGILIIGTGSNEDEAFRAFDQDFIDAKFNDTINGGRGVYSQYSYYAYSGDLEFADIKYGSSWGSNPGVYNGYSSGSMDGIAVKQQGRGAIVLVSFSLSGRGLDESYFVSHVIEECEDLGLGRANGRTSVNDYDFERILKDMEGPGRLNKAALRIIIIAYIILIGPVLYLILNKMDKREKIWLAVPGVSLVFVLLIFLIGQGFSVHTRIFETVTIAAADGNGEQVAYLLGFDSKAREWSITVDDEITAAGPAVAEGYYAMEMEYLYLSSFTPDGVKLNYRPNGLFDEAYFRTAAPNAIDSGEFGCDLELSYSGKIKGHVVNDTDYDFDYLLVSSGGAYAVIGGLKSGSSTDVSVVGNSYGGNNVSWIRGEAEKLYDKHDYVGCREYCSLALAYLELSGYDSFVIGVRANPDKVIRSGAREDAFLCIYGIDESGED